MTPPSSGATAANNLVGRLIDVGVLVEITGQTRNRPSVTIHTSNCLPVSKAAEGHDAGQEARGGVRLRHCRQGLGRESGE
jgi:hypothetical protein